MTKTWIPIQLKWLRNQTQISFKTNNFFLKHYARIQINFKVECVWVEHEYIPLLYVHSLRNFTTFLHGSRSEFVLWTKFILTLIFRSEQISRVLTAQISNLLPPAIKKLHCYYDRQHEGHLTAMLTKLIQFTSNVSENTANNSQTCRFHVWNVLWNFSSIPINWLILPVRIPTDSKDTLNYSVFSVITDYAVILNKGVK